jgi:NAD(P)-dependent dehydrogenase (short-subunit alcohol dehydrogenase family)
MAGAAGMLDDLVGRRVMVTGAGSGIGLAVTTRFLDAGAVVGACTLPGDEQGIAALEGVRGDRPLHLVEADVADSAAVDEAFGRFATDVGSVEVLVSNAGVGQKKPFVELTDADWAWMLGVHVGGAVNTARAVLPAMVENGFGRVMFTASELVTLGLANLTHYCAAKGALVSLARALAREVGKDGVTVNCVAPGPTITPMFTAAPDEFNDENMSTIPMRTFGDPDNIAWTWLFLASDAGRWFTGQSVAPNGGVAM